MRYIILLIFSFFSTAFNFAQSPDTLWTRTYGGANDDRATSIGNTMDGGYIIAGYTNSKSAGGYDVWLIRINDTGDTLWTRTYGGLNDDYGYSVQQTSDSGFVVVGHTSSFGNGENDVYLLRLDNQGEIIWTKTYGGSDNDYAFSVKQTFDNGFIVAGYTESFGNPVRDILLIKFNEVGDTLWTFIYDGEYWSEGHSVQQTSDGGFIVVGKEYLSANGYDALLIRLDNSGNVLWTRNYGGSETDEGYYVQQTMDGGFIFTGYTNSISEDRHVLLIKTDNNGNALWTKAYGENPPFGSERGNFVLEVTDGGYIIGGVTYSVDTFSEDLYVIRTNDSGEVQWTYKYGGDFDDQATSLLKSQDGGYIIAGWTESFGDAFSNAWLLKLGRDIIGIDEELISTPNRYTLTQNFPNPFNPETTISYGLPRQSDVTLIIYNLMGQEIIRWDEQNVQSGYYSKMWNGTNKFGVPVGSGVYLYKLVAGSFIGTRKMVLLK